MAKAVNFEKSVERLDEILTKLEGNDLTLEESVKLYEEGMKLVLQCDKEISRAKLKIEEIGALKKEPGQQVDTD